MHKQTKKKTDKFDFIQIENVYTSIDTIKESESHSIVSNSLGSHELYSPWNSPGQDTGVGSCSLL